MLDKYRYLLFAESKVSFNTQTKCTVVVLVFLLRIDFELMDLVFRTRAATWPLGRDGDDRPDVHSGRKDCSESRQNFGKGETRYAQFLNLHGFVFVLS